jgi:phage shock protein PspC (stress-responsive transcriptional regulator)
MYSTRVICKQIKGKVGGIAHFFILKSAVAIFTVILGLFSTAAQLKTTFIGHLLFNCGF